VKGGCQLSAPCGKGTSSSAGTAHRRGRDTLANIANVTGSSGNDTITGNAGNNVIDGGTDTVKFNGVAAAGEYDFSDEKIRDSVGIPPPKIVPRSYAQMGEKDPHKRLISGAGLDAKGRFRP
jgi:Ca2+-binding RTX toxin-like protein